MESGKRKHDGQAPSFLPSATFQGAKPGYFFSRSAAGVGYHADPRAASAMPPPPKRAAVARSGAALLEAAEAEAGGGDEEVVDARAVRRMVLGLERRLKDNLAARIKARARPGSAQPRCRPQRASG